jgi:hypothetical protein
MYFWKMVQLLIFKPWFFVYIILTFLLFFLLGGDLSDVESKFASLLMKNIIRSSSCH